MTEWQPGCSLRADIKGAACVTTMICVLAAARAIRRARGPSKLGCMLVSGSFRTISAGGRGVKRAAIQRSYRSVPSDSSAALRARSRPCCFICKVNRPKLSSTNKQLPGKASLTVELSAAPSPNWRIVSTAAAISLPSSQSIGVNVPT